MTVQTVNLASLAEAKRILKDACGVSSLLARPESNPKLAKGMKQGVMSTPLHLAPADLSGYEVCPMATNGCRKACLHTAGNPAHMAGKQRARVARTKLYFQQRGLFLSVLIVEIAALVRKAEKAGVVPAVRLNATSDIPWERVKFTHNGEQYANLMELFPTVQFYDYTKRPNRKGLPSNYHVTFSLAEDNDILAANALEAGLNVAVVFDTKRNHELPKSFDIGPYRPLVIDGDKTDFRPSDPRGVIVGLRAKGDAIGDTSGFVRAA
jgi:hypothetical protein